jgi:hypothetical protein
LTTRPTPARAPVLAPLSVLLAAAAALLLPSPGGRPALSATAAESDAGPGDAGEIERLARQNHLVRQQVVLAASGDFYLLLHVAGRRLELMLGGTLLHGFLVQAVEVGTPRLMFVERRPPGDDWEDRIWSAGRLNPPRERERLEIPVPENGGEAATPPIPPLPEELPVPCSYAVRFEEGLTVTVERHGEEEGSGGDHRSGPPACGWLDRLAARWDELRGALRRKSADTARVKIIMDDAEADSLYRSLPPGVRFLIIADE